MTALANSVPHVRGLALPALLVNLMRAGDWRNPGDDVLREILPWFEDPLDFLPTTDQMGQDSLMLDMWADDERSSRTFHVIRGSQSGSSWLPWLDVERAVLIAANRNIGDDVGIALDYRGDDGEPAVVASDPWTYPGGGYLWRLVAPGFDAFVSGLGLAP
jgi:hypothetical protein